MAALALNKNFENNENVATEKNVLPAKTVMERKSLKTLQVGSDGKVTGLETKKLPLKKFAVLNKPVKVFVDKKRTWLEMGTQTDSASHEEREAQTELTGSMHESTGDVHNDSGVGAGDIDQEAYDLMVKEPIPEHYWRDLAEERRCALAESLSENEMLHQSMEELKEENQNLSLLASQAEYLASVLNRIMENQINIMEKSWKYHGILLKKDVLGEKTDEDNKDTEDQKEGKNTDTEKGEDNPDKSEDNPEKGGDDPEKEADEKEESKDKEITEKEKEEEN